MGSVRSDCMYCACLYNLHSTDSQIFELGPISIKMYLHSIIFFSYVVQCFTKFIDRVSWHLQCESARHWQLITNQLIIKYFLHGVTKPTSASWYCKPLHYFTDSDQLDSWIYLPVPSNDPSQWTHRKAYRCKGCHNQTLTLNTITSNDQVSSVHQLSVNNVMLHKMVHDKDIHKFVYYYILKMKY